MEKILLVDDVKLLLEMQKGLLSSSRLDIVTAGDGVEALAVARRETPSLIVMDNHMPNMDGVTCCREIQADPLLKRIPVIMLTNAVRAADVAEYRSAGAVDVIAKPIDGRQYLSTLKKYLPAVECRGARVPLAVEVALNVDSRFIQGLSRDVSVKGIKIASEFQPVPGQEIRFSFQLPGSEAPAEVRGKVAWVRRQGAGCEFGVEFIEIVGKGLPFIRKRELESFVALHSDTA